MKPAAIIKKALNARTLEDAEAVQAMIENHIGAKHQRPLGDRWGNGGMLKGGGASYDHKIIEVVTNMQDAVIERAAAAEYGDLSKVPFGDPRSAAESLFSGVDYRDLADKVAVEFHAASGRPRDTGRITATFRDQGAGMTPEQMPKTIFHLGSMHKDGKAWLQGAFGMGGATTYSNAQAVVVVTRRVPELLDGQDDRIAVAVVQWEHHQKNRGCYYLVDSDPEDGGGIPLSVPASEYPDFAPGTYLALIGYGVEGFHRARLGDERSFDTVLNTRLFRPVLPVRFANPVEARDRNEYLRGLHRRLDDNPGTPPRESNTDVLPFGMNGDTYHLPITYYVFAEAGAQGARRRFVAHDHAVLFTSNGQAHHHWTPLQFKAKTGLNKLQARVLVIVDTDELPVGVRHDLFTGDRTSMMRTDPAIKLEEHVAGFLSGWNDLVDINNGLIEEAIRSATGDRPTIEIARRISRALTIRGFSLAGLGTSGGGGGSGGGGPRPPIDLYDDPTTLEGPEHVLAEDGRTKYINFVLNAVDDFVPARAHLSVVCDHPEIGAREITIGRLRRGVIRVSVAVPLNAELGDFELTVGLDGWLRSNGGLGASMEWTTNLEIVDELPSLGTEPKGKKGKKGAKKGGQVALIWTDHTEQSEWDKATVGEVQLVSGEVLSARDGYGELASLGDTKVPAILLNTEYHGLKAYVGGRARRIEDLDALRSRYAIGVGVGLVILHQDEAAREKAGESLDPDWIGKSRTAVARSVLSMMPEYDMLAREVGLEED